MLTVSYEVPLQLLDQECFLGTGGTFSPFSSAKGFNSMVGQPSARGGLERYGLTWGQVTFLCHVLPNPVYIKKASLPVLL